MMLHIPGVLPADAIARCRRAFASDAWVDGRVTAGHQAARAKRNLQLPEDAPEARALTGEVLTALERNALYFSAVLPHRYSQILFNRYEQEMQFAAHVDNAVRPVLGGGGRVRTDVSATLFISEPDSYEGGELVVEDVYGSHAVKLPAGDLIVYPSTSVHHVTPVTAGAREVCVFWVESMVRDGTRRALLFDLDMAIRSLSDTNPDHPSVVMFTATYHNLLRQWVET